MAFDEIQQVLYGPWRPWIPREAQAVLQAGTDAVEKQKAPSVDKLSIVHSQPPFNRLSMGYAQLIDQAFDRGLRQCVHAVEEAAQPVDRTYRFKKSLRELEDIIKSADDLWYGQEQAILTNFVLRRIVGAGMNIRLDLGLRYRVLLSDNAVGAKQLYLQLLDRPLPECGLFTKSEAWYKQELQQRLEKVIEDEAKSDEIIKALVDGLQAMAAETGSIPPSVTAHAADALFLLKSGASFIFDEPGRLTDTSFCAEWIRGMKKELMQGGADDMFSTLPAIYAELSRIKDIISACGETLELPSGSEAIQWLVTVDGLPAATATVHRSKPEKELPDIPFFKEFRSCYIHKQEVEQALDIDPKTLKGYIKGSGVRALQLKSNIWYYRPDIERFFEDETHKQ